MEAFLNEARAVTLLSVFQSFPGEMHVSDKWTTFSITTTATTAFRAHLCCDFFSQNVQKAAQAVYERGNAFWKDSKRFGHQYVSSGASLNNGQSGSNNIRFFISMLQKPLRPTQALLPEKILAELFSNYWPMSHAFFVVAHCASSLFGVAWLSARHSKSHPALPVATSGGVEQRCADPSVAVQVNLIYTTNSRVLTAVFLTLHQLFFGRNRKDIACVHLLSAPLRRHCYSPEDGYFHEQFWLTLNAGKRAGCLIAACNGHDVPLIRPVSTLRHAH